jgi:hypothetical protein
MAGAVANPYRWRRTLALLMSKCTIFRACKYTKALATSSAICASPMKGRNQQSLKTLSEVQQKGGWQQREQFV